MKLPVRTGVWTLRPSKVNLRKLLVSLSAVCMLLIIISLRYLKTGIQKVVMDCRFDVFNKSHTNTDYWNSTTSDLPLCNETTRHLRGSVDPKANTMDDSKLASMFPNMTRGHYTPNDCLPMEKVAIIIPFRDRHSHLYTMLPIVLSMLIRQKIDFTIFVVEQNLPTTFNKGVVLNAGFLEALKISNYDCFIFHDVDLLPLSDRNIYTCNSIHPVHFMSGVDKFKYRLLYDYLIGGVLGFTQEQFRTVNGFSNLYFGWGSEDDDMFIRITAKNLTIHRKAATEGLYNMIRHKRDKRWNANIGRFNITQFGEQKVDDDGLNCVTYLLTKINYKPCYIWINIFVNMTEVYARAPPYMTLQIANVRAEDEHNRIKEGTAISGQMLK